MNYKNIIQVIGLLISGTAAAIGLIIGFFTLFILKNDAPNPQAAQGIINNKMDQGIMKNLVNPLAQNFMVLMFIVGVVGLIVFAYLVLKNYHKKQLS